jgi:quercetin dioxygenase-like cupin family protein
MSTQSKREPQKFTVSHLAESDFTEGLRSYASYRDLGMVAATSGAAVAHVIKFKPPCTDEVQQWHTHDVEFQMIYVLKGWITTEMEGRKPETMRVGSCWLQPPLIKHRVMDYSDDCELLEIVLPADFETEML